MSDSQLAVQSPPALLAVAGLTGLDKQYLVETIKRQCFKGAADDAQVDAFISIACEMKVNPLLPGMLYAYPISGGGIVPIMGPSGVYKKLVEHPEVDSWETEVFPPDVSLPPTHAVTRIYRKGREKPLQYTALLSEWKINSNPNWNSRPRHMLALRSLKHCANQIIHGIPYDEDDRVIMAMQNVTGTGGESGPATQAEGVIVEEKKRPEPVPRAKRGAAAAKEVMAEIVDQGVKTAAELPDIQQAMKDREAKMAPAPAGEPAKADDPQPSKPAAPAEAPAPRVFLKDKEIIDVVCKIESFAATLANQNGQPVPFIKGVVSGGFAGEVRDKTHCKLSADKKTAVADPVWAVGSTVNIKLRGALSTVAEKTASGQPNPLYGKVLNWIDAISAVEQGESLE